MIVAPMVGVYAALVLLVALNQRSLLYQPTPRASVAPPGGEALEFETSGSTLRGWVLGRDNARAVLYFGGNAERLALGASEMARLVGERALYLLDYRGYGASEGEPEEEGLRADALEVFDRIRQRHASVALVGRSLGTALAVWVASQRPTERLALISPYDSMVAVARTHYWWLPVSLLLQDRFEAERWAPDIDAPALVVIAAQDRVIPPARSLRLAEGLKRVRVVEVPEAGHNSLALPAAFREFFDG